jgi:hypothetical protein
MYRTCPATVRWEIVKGIWPGVNVISLNEGDLAIYSEVGWLDHTPK